MQNTSLQANIARNSLQIVVVAKQAADAKNARYICKNNTLSFWVFFCLETRLTYAEYKTEQNKKDL